MLLAIDPGNELSGYVYCDNFNIIEAGNLPNDKLLEIIQTYTFDNLAIEKIASYGMSVGATVFDTCIWIGRFIQQAETYSNSKIHLVPRIQIKVHHCKTAKAKDGNVVRALKDRFGEKGTKKNPGYTYKLSSHSWQAFALAVYCFDNLNDTNLIYNIE